VSSQENDTWDSIIAAPSTIKRWKSTIREKMIAEIWIDESMNNADKKRTYILPNIQYSFHNSEKVPDWLVTEACTVAYGSAYGIVLLTRGPRSGSAIIGCRDRVLVVGERTGLSRLVGSCTGDCWVDGLFS